MEQVGGTHPTGMHSSLFKWSKKALINRINLMCRTFYQNECRLAKTCTKRTILGDNTLFLQFFAINTMLSMLESKVLTAGK